MDLLDGGHWLVVKDGDPRARALYLRHYSARKAESKATGTFVGPGEKMVLLSKDCQAIWVWRKMKYRRDDQWGIECFAFRNESSVLSSELILEAEQLGLRRWPGARLWTYVDPSEVGSSNPGFCYEQAGWSNLGKQSNGLVLYERIPLRAMTREVFDVIETAQILVWAWDNEDSDWYEAADWLKEAIHKLDGTDSKDHIDDLVLAHAFGDHLYRNHDEDDL